MANCNYVLFGQEYTESQGKMMARVFEELLSRYPQKLPAALQQFPCLSAVDYEQDRESLREAPAAFLNKKTFVIAGQTICIGTSYNKRQKQIYIRRLFLLCGEDPGEFQILRETSVSSDARVSSAQASPKKRSREGKLRYRLFGKSYASSQADMMYLAFEEILLRKPELTDWAVESLHCASQTDFTRPENKEADMPAQFRSCRILQMNGKKICIGSGYNLKAKLDLIDRLRQQAGLSKDIFLLYPDFDLTYWQKEAAEAVLGAFHTRRSEERRLGIVSMPTGAGKTVLLAALFSQLMQEEDGDFSVLLLTGRAQLAAQYAASLSYRLGQICPVSLAGSRKELAEKAAVPGTILISTAQKLLGEGMTADERGIREAPAPYSVSSRLLVVVEEIFYPYFSRTYGDMHARFPHAVFLGMTSYGQPSRQLRRVFGDPLYEYTFAQAYQDGLLRRVDYYCVNPWEDGTEAAASEKRRKGYFFKTKEAYEKKARLMAEWTQQTGSGTFALLLCNYPIDAAEFYWALKAFASEGKFEVYLHSSLSRNSSPYDQSMIPENSQWNGKRFHGIVIACRLDGENLPFDLLFLDQIVKSADRLLPVLTPLQRRGTQNETSKGILVDFCNDPDSINRLLTPDIPVYIQEKAAAPSTGDSLTEQEILEAGLQKLSKELFQYEFSAARETFLHLQETFPETTGQLAEELKFLFQPRMSQEKQMRYWKQHRRELEWKSSLWNLFSIHSKNVIETGTEEADEEPESMTEPMQEEEVSAVSSEENPQARGAALEEAVLELFRRIFDLDQDQSQLVLRELRRQTSGTQRGFDIKLTCQDSLGAMAVCMIECKNYQNGIIRLRDVAPKLAALQCGEEEADHWILISPNSRLSNELSEAAKKWKDSFLWEPIRDVQFWTQEEKVQELFALFPDLYTRFYGEWQDSPYKDWDAEKRKQVAENWRAKLAPVPLLPRNWREYLRDPGKLLTQCESDRDTCERYANLYENHVPMHLLDEEELPIEGTAEAYVQRWLAYPEKNCMLLLGDFGDGKTYFTYTLARRIAERFLASPKTGWIPLRFTLSDLRDRLMDCREFLRRRLQEFGGTLDEWNDIQRNHHFLIILDGLDEMSLGMDDTAVLENLGRLQEVMEQFKGHKFLITSRKMAVYADKIREQILECLNEPEILHLAPITQRDRLDFLVKYADTPKRKERLLKMQHTHDLLGLAAKPLFLEMLQVLLDDDDITALDAAGIYRQYTERVLARKFTMQLKLDRDYTHPKRVRANVVRLLENLALCLQQEGTDSISLEEFKRKIGQKNLAELLWSTIGTSDTDGDADNRMMNRSLLKYDRRDSKKACFCHRSMKEYFVARGLVHCLQETPEKGKRLLMECSFGYEILEFAGKAVLGSGIQEQRGLVQNLYTFAHETKGKAKDPLRESYQRLGTNSVNLLSYTGFGLEGKDWSGLLLDYVILSGMDLAGKDFSYSSMRYAHLENADLTDCNLRGCDFTGVQFEKSGQLAAFAADSKGGELLAFYKDGKIRKWGIADGSFCLLSDLKLGCSSRIVLLDGGCEGMVQSGYFQFWNRTAKMLLPAGGVFMHDHTRILDVGKTRVLFWQKGKLCVAELSTGRLLLQREEPEDIRACFMEEGILAVHKKRQGIEIIDLSKAATVLCLSLEEQPVTALCACAVSETEGFLVTGHKNGSVRSYYVKQERENGSWSYRLYAELPEGKESVSESAADEAGGIYTGDFSGRIVRYRKTDTGVLQQDQEYQLEIRCAGAEIDGVYPKEQYEILLQAKRES